jgi:hypothetical protein
LLGEYLIWLSALTYFVLCILKVGHAAVPLYGIHVALESATGLRRSPLAGVCGKKESITNKKEET